MKFSGFKITNFRSIGEDSVEIFPFKKCNILIGQNNTGKSNFIRAIKIVPDWVIENKIILSNIDIHDRNNQNPIIFKLYFSAEESEFDKQLIHTAGTNTYWFELTWRVSAGISITNSSFATLTDFNLTNELLSFLSNKRWNRRVNTEEIQLEFRKLAPDHFQKFTGSIPRVLIIPEFRQIHTGDSYNYDGTNLVEILGQYQHPDIGKDEDQKKFNSILQFIRNLLHLPDALLEVSRSTPEIIITNNGLRLPLKSFGTGVHELLILLTAVLSIEHAICCIEEPEIHLHPRLQREFINFLIHETSNQYVISTHSASFINCIESVNDMQLVHLTFKNGETIGKPILNQSNAVDALQDLGVRPSDLIQSNCIIWVEGPSDRVYIRKWLEILAPDLKEGDDFIFLYYREYPRITLERENVYTGLINLLEVNQNLILVADSDKNSHVGEISPGKIELAEKCREYGGISWITDGREIENYIPPSVIKLFFQKFRDCEVEPIINPYEKFSNLIDRIAVKNQVEKFNYSCNKTNYSKIISGLFTIDDIQGQLKTHIEEIISKIKSWKE